MLKALDNIRCRFNPPGGFPNLSSFVQAAMTYRLSAVGESPIVSLIGLAAQGRSNARSCAVSSAWRPGVCPKRYARACPRHYFSATYTLPGGRRRRHTGRPPFPYTVLLPTVASVSISSRHRRSSTPTVNDPRAHCGDSFKMGRVWTPNRYPFRAVHCRPAWDSFASNTKLEQPLNLSKVVQANRFGRGNSRKPRHGHYLPADRNHETGPRR